MGPSSYVLSNLKLIWEHFPCSGIALRVPGMVLVKVRGCNAWGGCAARVVPMGSVDGSPQLGMMRGHRWMV